MDLLSEDINRLLRLRTNPYRSLFTTAINLICLNFIARQVLINVKIYFDCLLNFLEGSFFDTFFNLDKFNVVQFMFMTFPLYNMYITHYLVYKSDTSLWDPLLLCLTKDNWEQFIQHNLDFELEQPM